MYEAWLKATIEANPAIKPKGSEEYEAWLQATIEANPACKPEGSEEYKAWLKATIEAIPACKPKGSHLRLLTFYGKVLFSLSDHRPTFPVKKLAV